MNPHFQRILKAVWDKSLKKPFSSSVIVSNRPIRVDLSDDGELQICSNDLLRLLGLDPSSDLFKNITTSWSDATTYDTSFILSTLDTVATNRPHVKEALDAFDWDGFYNQVYAHFRNILHKEGTDIFQAKIEKLERKKRKLEWMLTECPSHDSFYPPAKKPRIQKDSND